MPPENNNLIWIDLEMTGLDLEKEEIIELATVVTNSHLEVIAEGPVLAIYQPDELLNQMDKWNTEHHGASGLIERVQKSTTSELQAEEQTLRFLAQHVASGVSPMCGNSICQDRRFLYKKMPRLAAYFHYRNLDVSTLKILAQRWAPQIADKLKKESQHIALQDIYDSIDELRFYRDHLFK